MSTQTYRDNFEDLNLEKTFNSNKHNRKTFYHRNHKGKNRKVTASGIIYYVIDRSQKVHWLLRYYKNKYEDFGGITKTYDRSPLDVGIRSTISRTNGLIFGSKDENSVVRFKIERLITNYNQNKIGKVYIDDSKYLLFLIRMPYHFFKNSVLNDSYRWVENFEEVDVHPRLEYIKIHNHLLSEIIGENIKQNKFKKQRYKSRKKSFRNNTSDSENVPSSENTMDYAEALCKDDREITVDDFVAVKKNVQSKPITLDSLLEQSRVFDNNQATGSVNTNLESTGVPTGYRPKCYSEPNTPVSQNIQSYNSYFSQPNIIKSNSCGAISSLNQNLYNNVNLTPTVSNYQRQTSYQSNARYPINNFQNNTNQYVRQQEYRPVKSQVTSGPPPGFRYPPAPVVSSPPGMRPLPTSVRSNSTPPGMRHVPTRIASNPPRFNNVPQTTNYSPPPGFRPAPRPSDEVIGSMLSKLGLF